MQLRIGARSLDVSPETRRGLRRRLRLALGRHAGRIATTEVTISPGGGATGGRARRCRIDVRLHEGARLTVEDHADDLPGAASAALWRLAHRLERPQTGRPAAMGFAEPRGSVPRRWTP